MTIFFHQRSHTTLKYCSHVIYESGYKLGSLRWKIGASIIRYRINKFSRPLCKSINLHLQIFIGKSQKPLLNQNKFSPCLTFSLLHCSRVTYLTHQDTAYQSEELVCHHPSLSHCHACYISGYIYLHIFHVSFLLKRHLSRGHEISCLAHYLEQTDDKPFSRLIGPTHINK